MYGIATDSENTFGVGPTLYKINFIQMFSVYWGLHIICFVFYITVTFVILFKITCEFGIIVKSSRVSTHRSSLTVGTTIWLIISTGTEPWEKVRRASLIIGSWTAGSLFV